MTRTRRIGLYTPGWPGQNTPNGIATSVYYLARGLQQTQMQPVILARNIDGPFPEDIPVVPLQTDLPWRWQDRLRSKIGDGEAGHRHMARIIADAVGRAQAEHGLDAVLMEETNGWARMVQEECSLPVFLTLHGPWVLLKTHDSRGSPLADQQRETRERKGYLAAPGIIAPSHNVLAAVEGATDLTATPRTVLPNSYAAPRPEVLSAARPEPDILFIGRFDYLKGGDTVLQAFARLAETHPDVRLSFAGPDKGLREADGRSTDIGAMLATLPEDIRARVTYLGPIDRAEVAQLRATHAICLIASRYENLNYSLLEAMAAGQAIVCTRVGGPSEVLEDGKTALLVPPGDPEAMAAALSQVLEDSALAGHLGEAARQKLEADFDPTHVARQTADFIGGILDKG